MAYNKSTNKTSQPSADQSEERKPFNRNNKKGDCSNNRDKKRGNRGKAMPKQDPFWYAEDPQAILDMASINFLETVGDVLPESMADRVPGVLIVKYKPTVGSELHEIDGARTYTAKAADAYFEVLTQGYSAEVPFEAPDMLMATLAGESLYAAMIEGKRVYGLMKKYAQFNSYYARDVVLALGFDFDDWKENLANFRSEFNILVNEVNKTVAVPKDFAIGDRWEFLGSHVFSDSVDPEYGTAIAWVSSGHLTYTPTLLDTGTCLTWTSKPSGSMTVQQYMQYLNGLLGALKDSDVRSMFGATRRVYSQDQLKTATPIDKDFEIDILHHDIVEAIMHNMIWPDAQCSGIKGFAHEVDSSNDNTNVALYQTSLGDICSYIVGEYNTSVGASTIRQPGSFLFDLYEHMYTPGNVLDMTSNMQFMDTDNIKPIGSTTQGIHLVCRTEAVEQVFVYGHNGVSFQVFKFNLVSAFALSTPNIAWISHINSCPILGFGTITTNIPYKCDYLGEIDKYTVLEKSFLKKLHSKTLYKLLAMPQNSKSITSRH